MATPFLGDAGLLREDSRNPSRQEARGGQQQQQQPQSADRVPGRPLGRGPDDSGRTRRTFTAESQSRTTCADCASHCHGWSGFNPRSSSTFWAS
jgi:hypothetical protein